MGVVWGLLTLFASPILVLFDASPEMLAIGVPAVRIFAVSYFLSTVGFVFATVFQALGRGDYSMWLTITRQVVLPILLAFIFTKTMGMLPLVWVAYVLSELISMPMSIVLMKKILRVIL